MLTRPFAAAQGDKWGEQQQECHAEPQRSIS